MNIYRSAASSTPPPSPSSTTTTRSQSPDKYTMRTTLRSGRPGDKPSKTSLKSSRPAGEGPSKAATLAWVAFREKASQNMMDASSDKTSITQATGQRCSSRHAHKTSSSQLQWDSHSRRLVPPQDPDSTFDRRDTASTLRHSNEYPMPSYLSVSAASSALTSSSQDILLSSQGSSQTPCRSGRYPVSQTIPPNRTPRSGKYNDDVLRSLPPGVDESAAKQILNDIVVQGDEVRWGDIAGLEVAKNALREAVVYPFLRPDLFMGLREPARGMLLFGPPGTGKTMLARAVATESQSTFFSISASSLTSKFLGESEKLVRALFSLAKVLAPSIIFVDEIDSLLSQRSGSGEHESTQRIKTEFLIQWSDLQRAAVGKETTDKDKGRGNANRVLVLAATNLPWAIDEAARRRFVRRQYIPLPEPSTREAQLRTLLGQQKHSLSSNDLDRLVELTKGFSGSDITALAKDAAMGPLRSLGDALLNMTMDDIRPIMLLDFEASLGAIRPSVSKAGLKEYEDWAREFGERGG